MPEVTVTTPRGVRLSGTLDPPTPPPATPWTTPSIPPSSPPSAQPVPPAAPPAAPPGAAVLFAHGFLAERSSRGRAVTLARAYRDAGYATLLLDLSGCGTSDDDVVTVGHEVEDVTAASLFLADAGWPRQVLHGHSLGALVALRTHSPHVEAMVLTGAVTGPIQHPWPEVLSTEQMDELDRTGTTRVLDDGPSPREHTVISRQTLADFVEIDQLALLADLTCPVLLIHGGDLVDGEEHPLLTRSRVGLPYLPAGSRLEVVRGGDHALLEHTDHVAASALAWLAERLPT